MEEKIALQLVSDFIANHGYTPKRLNQKAMQVGKKSPDFEIYKANNLFFLCELKTVELIPNPQTNPC